MRVEIIDVDHMGNGIAKIDNKIIFIPKTVPGDICDIEIIKNNKKFSNGVIKRIITSSSERIDSLCPYYNRCGGCNISNLSYEKQLIFKKNKVINIFKKYLGIDINPEIIGSEREYNYRNKITFHNDEILGLVSIDNSIVNVDKCLLVSDKVNELLNVIKKEDLSRVKLLTIKEVENGLILSITGNMVVDKFKDRCLQVIINNKVVYKKEDGYIYIGNIKYFVSYDSFFQVNTDNIYKLYDLVIKYGNFNKKDNVIDLYCGVGSISLYIAKYVKNVLGIEIVDNAIMDAQNNAKVNGIKNVNFICGDVSKLTDNINGNKTIVDPPRIGLDDKTISVLNDLMIEKIIYVSCDSMTLVRDIKKLDKYKVETITLVDMFPQTHHVECVLVLHRK